MDKKLHDKYKDVLFSKDQISMFAEIICSDKVTKKVFLHIGSELQKQISSKNTIGLTVNDIVQKVTVNRKEKVTVGNSFKFKDTNTNIEKKTAERIVNKLLDMSLLYYDSVKPYKFLHMTNRGLQIINEVLNNAVKKEGVN